MEMKVSLNYDQKSDTLRVAYGAGQNSYGDDSVPGIVCMRDMDTDEITGFTVMHFLKSLTGQCAERV